MDCLAATSSARPKKSTIYAGRSINPFLCKETPYLFNKIEPSTLNCISWTVKDDIYDTEFLDVAPYNNSISLLCFPTWDFSEPIEG